MKIAYLCSDSDIPVLGSEGCSVHIRAVADALGELGHEVCILCSWLGEGQWPRKAHVLEIGPEPSDRLGWDQLAADPLIQQSNLERDLRSVAFNSWMQIAGARVLERQRPDFLYERYSLFGWSGVELGRRFGIPLLLEVNAPLSLEQEGYEKFTLTRTAERMEAHILAAADRVIVVSQWLQDWVVSRGGDARKVEFIPNGVATDLFAAMPTGAAVRERWQLDGTRVIGFVGSFQPWHDVAGLLRVFARLAAQRGDLRLLLVGDGPGRQEMEELASGLGLRSSVVFSGHVPHETIPEYLAAIDIAVSPFERRSQPLYGSMKLFEYLAMARPTVTAGVGQREEVVEHGRTGWVYPPGDHEKLAEALITLLDDPGRAAALGQAARQEVLARHTWNAVARRIVGLAESVLRERGSR